MPGESPIVFLARSIYNSIDIRQNWVENVVEEVKQYWVETCEKALREICYLHRNKEDPMAVAMVVVSGVFYRAFDESKYHCLPEYLRRNAERKEHPSDNPHLRCGREYVWALAHTIAKEFIELYSTHVELQLWCG